MASAKNGPSTYQSSHSSFKVNYHVFCQEIFIIKPTNDFVIYSFGEVI